MSDTIVNNEQEIVSTEVNDIPIIETTIDTQSHVKVEETVKVEEPIKDVVMEIAKSAFQQLFEELLSQDKQIDKLNIQLSPDVKKYLLLLCKDKSDLLVSIEESLKKIVVDDKINTKDIPEIMILITKIYELIKTNKRNSNIDPYDLISTLLQLIFIAYFELNNINNPELEDTLLHIIDSAIQLIKLKNFKSSRKGCFSSIFKF
jgi:hypothetical protein